MKFESFCFGRGSKVKLRAFLDKFGLPTRQEVLFLLRGLGVQTLGAISNLTVKHFNGGKMPCPDFPEDIAAAGQSSTYISAFSNSIKLRFLSDWIPVGSYYASIGDVLLYGGLLLLVISCIIVIVRRLRVSKSYQGVLE